MQNSPQGTIVAELDEVERTQFYKKTYAHVAGAVLAFIGFEYVLFNFFEA